MEYISELVSFVAGAIGGFTLHLTITRKSADHGGRVVDQSGVKALGDVVGGDKVSSDKSQNATVSGQNNTVNQLLGGKSGDRHGE
ncbi:hypothetical protein A9Q83_07775 [Alphaproteobacteria bacterium 46_93_T64]|nr:hypothetical protein A9Q83_07775 [Alphaproteobacteria bacterium 46_93_T64]